jgi:hypothetical protein
LVLDSAELSLVVDLLTLTLLSLHKNEVSHNVVNSVFKVNKFVQLVDLVESDDHSVDLLRLHGARGGDELGLEETPKESNDILKLLDAA